MTQYRDVMRPIPVMLALLLALSPGAVAMQASAPTSSAHAQTSPADGPAAAQSDTTTMQMDTVRAASSGNTTAVMTLGTAPAQSEFDRPSIALGSSLATERGGIQSSLSIATLDQQLQAANSAEQKKQILNRYRYRIENHIISLKAEERQATQAFSNETMSKSEYLRTIARIDAEADGIRELAKAMQERAASVPRFSMETEANTLKGKLVTLEGPIRERIGRMLQGQAPPTRVYVETAKNGIVLSTIANGEYVREVVRMDRRNPGASDPIGRQVAQRKIVEQYPWAWNNSKSWGIDTIYGTTNVYRMYFRHAQGRLLVYYDAGTEEVFKEVQYKQLTGEHSVPPGPGVSNSSNNLTLVVNRTYPGGPLRVNLTNETGVPLQGDITVAGEPVGRTHADGTLWTLGPAEEFRVTATYRGRTVNVTTTPVNAS